MDTTGGNKNKVFDCGDTLMSKRVSGEYARCILMRDIKASNRRLGICVFAYFPKIRRVSKRSVFLTCIGNSALTTVERVSMVLTERVFKGLTTRVNEGEFKGGV